MEPYEEKLFNNNQRSHYPQHERRPLIRLTVHLIFLATRPSDVKKSFSVLKTLHFKAWKDAMEKEMEYICENKTWILVDLLRKKSPITTRWVVETKIGNIRKVGKLKARLVAKGCK